MERVWRHTHSHDSQQTPGLCALPSCYVVENELIKSPHLIALLSKWILLVWWVGWWMVSCVCNRSHSFLQTGIHFESCAFLRGVF